MKQRSITSVNLNALERLGLFLCWPFVILIVTITVIILLIALVCCWPLVLIPGFVKRNF